MLLFFFIQIDSYYTYHYRIKVSNIQELLQRTMLKIRCALPKLSTNIDIYPFNMYYHKKFTKKHLPLKSSAYFLLFRYFPAEPVENTMW